MNDQTNVPRIDTDQIVAWLNRTADATMDSVRDRQGGIVLMTEPEATMLRAAAASIDAYKLRKNQAYEERNRVVALLATIAIMFGKKAGIQKTNIPNWHAEWHNCVYIQLAEGRLSWHYHDSQAYLFAHLPPCDILWDGHTTVSKYRQIEELIKELAEVGPKALQFNTYTVGPDFKEYHDKT